jgi:hypothetical protein
MLAVGEERRLGLCTSFLRLFHNATQTLTLTYSEIKKYEEEANMTRPQFRELAKEMMEYYQTSDSKPKPRDLNDEICTVLMARQELIDHIKKVIASDEDAEDCAWKALGKLVATKYKGRVKPSDNKSSLNNRLNALLAEANQTLEDWLDGESLEPTALYLKCKDEAALRELKVLKAELFKILMLRSYELEALHGTSMMGNVFSSWSDIRYYKVLPLH